MLTDITIRNAKPRQKPYKLSDGSGLYLLIQPNQGRYWRMKYRYAGKEKTLSIGKYPDISLLAARDARENAKKLLREGGDPSFEKQQEKIRKECIGANTFEIVSKNWWEHRRNAWTDKHAKAVLHTLEANIFPYLGKHAITDITAPELLATIRRIEERGSLEMASKVLQRCAAVYRFAISSGLAINNPAVNLREVLKTPEKRNHAALSEIELPTFLDQLNNYDGDKLTQLGLRLLILTFVRSNELRGAKWDEFNFNKAEWRIPAERMKMKVEHIVPLSIQSINTLHELEEINGARELVFASISNPKKCISGNALLFALYRMGYHSRATVHGFRQTASTMLNEQGFSCDAIERQLAHAESNKVRAAYNKAQYMPERKRMMQWWANRLDECE